MLTPSPFGDLVDINGESFPATPKWQVQGDAEYEFPLQTGLSAFFCGNASYRSRTQGQFGSKSGPAGTEGFFILKGYALLDLRGGVDIGGKYRIQVFGQNVTGTHYWTSAERQGDTYVRLTGFPLAMVSVSRLGSDETPTLTPCSSPQPMIHRRTAAHARKRLGCGGRRPR